MTALSFYFLLLLQLLQETLLKPNSLQPNNNGRFQEQNFKFYLTPSQSNEITNSNYRNDQGKPEYRTQIIIRFSLLEISSEQDDNFPASISLKVCSIFNPQHLY